ncbi:leucine-rich repeat and IQ domain-containing protein 1 [Pelobates fuscus]|uniref:leucine-rich repeat and IQ domain-containing protein 1 n=1 Tax=Pelobates fuscus TaxID=191477 RepID=UPI002FE451EC
MEVMELELRGVDLPGDAEDEEPSEDEDDEEDYEAVIMDDSEDEVSDDLPESVLLCLQAVKRRSENTELFLQDLESGDPCLSDCSESGTSCNLPSELQDPDVLTKVLAEIEEDERRQQSRSDNIIGNNDDHNSIQGTVVVETLDDNDSVLKFDYIEVEESCKRKLQQWEDEQEKHSEIGSHILNSQTEIANKQDEEGEWKGDWRKQFEKEISVLDTIHKEQQKKLEEDLQKHNEALAKDLKKHKEMIYKLETEMKNEKNNFAEEKAKAKKLLEELQFKSAIKIQAQFRAFSTYKKYSPILMERKKEAQRKKELKLKLEQEKKEMEEKIKRKLEDKKRREEEKKQKEELETQALEEAKIQERLLQEMRQREYEKKKSEERQRLERQKHIKDLNNKHICEKTEKTNTMLEKNNDNITCTKDSMGDLNKQNEEYVHPGKEKIEEMIKEQTGKSEKEFKPTEVMESLENNESRTVNKPEEIDLNAEICDASQYSATDSVQLSDPSRNPSLTEDKHVCPFDQSTCAHKNIVSENNSKPPLPVQDSKPLQPVAGMDVGVKTVAQKERNEDSAVSIVARSLVLPDHTEEKRLAWMKSCKPWARILRDSQGKRVDKKTKQRKISAAKRLPPLNENLIFQNNTWRDLRQITTVTLQDLPGCSLATLSSCAKLRFLSMRRCGLIALEDITDCKALQYIDVQENSICVVNCEGLENLNVLLLNKNQITSIHGLENCINLRNLELSYNVITRVGGLETLRNLQRLVLDHNQLISTSRLEAVPTLMYLDCSYNFLTELEGIQNCGLMQILKLQGNNLCEIPKLDNHVLLRELYVDDNNISAVKGLSLYWLPLLQVLSISQNSLVQLEPLYTFVSLEELDLNSNCLSDLQSTSLWLEGCVSLRHLTITKNPLVQEANWRSFLLNLLPGLRQLNADRIDCNERRQESHTRSFRAFCQSQIRIVRQLWKVINQDKGSCMSFKGLENYCNTFKGLLKVSNEHRYAHEYGDIEDIQREDPEILENDVEQSGIDSSQHNGLVISGGDDSKHEDPTRQITSRQLTNSSAAPKGRDQVELLGKTSTKNKVIENRNNACNAKKDINDCELMKMSKCSAPVGNKKHCAAVIIQSHWRGYVVRRDIDYYARLHEAASVIQSAWRSYSIRKRGWQNKADRNPKCLDVKNHAATVIQAIWKGFHLRKKLAAAFAAIEREEPEDDFEEVNLDDFTFDEHALDKGWTLNSTDFSSAALHCSNRPEHLKFPKRIPVAEDKAHSLPWRPVEAWQTPGSSEADSVIYDRTSNDSRLEKQNLSHASNVKSQIDISFMSEKEEKISHEWGFKDSATAHLMLKRAQKMKSKQIRNKKMLDPTVRLALFKNNENKHLPVKPPKKPQMKVEYFQGVEESNHLRDISAETLARSRELTYQWLHTQCGDFEATNSRITKHKRFLPELNHDVLNGGRVQLVANTAKKETEDLELVSVKSGNTFNQNRSRLSSALLGRDQFTPQKTISGPQKKERISFRDIPTQLSGGWGSGKKKKTI